MLFLAKRRNGSAWEESAESTLRMPKQKRTSYDTPPVSSDVSSAWHSWDESWESNLWEPWQNQWGWQKDDWTWQDAEPKGRGKGKKRDKNTGKTMKKPSTGEASQVKTSICAPADLPEGLSFSGVVNAFEPKSGNLLIDCPSVSQIFGRPPFIRPEDNGMNARVGSMVVFRLHRGEIPVVSDVAINGFDSEVGLQPDSVQSDDADVAGFLPNAKGAKGAAKDTSGDNAQKGSFRPGGKSPGSKDQRAMSGGSKGLKGRGKASPIHPWRAWVRMCAVKSVSLHPFRPSWQSFSANRLSNKDNKGYVMSCWICIYFYSFKMFQTIVDI